MRVKKVLLYTLPVVGILLAGSLIIFNFVRKRPEKEEELKPPSALEDELKKREEESRKRMEEMQKEILEKKLREGKKALEELEKREKEVVDEFAKHLKKPEERLPKIILTLDSGFPTVDPITYTSGVYMVAVSKTTFTSDSDLVDFTHTLLGIKFLVTGVQFGGKTYTIKPIEATMATSIAFAADPGFCYFLLIPGPDSKPIFFKNDGDKFLRCVGYPKVKEEIIEMATKFNRLPKGVEIPAPPGVKPEAPTPTPTTITPSVPPTIPTPITPSAPPTTPPTGLNFNLTVQNKFMIGSQEVKLNITHEYEGVYEAHKYFIERGSFTPTSFSIGDLPQTGLPVNQTVDTIVVYFHRVTMGEPVGIPLIVLIFYKNQSRKYLNKGNGNWEESKALLFREELDYLDSIFNDFVTVNLSRRSDYYRNGTGTSEIEQTLDMNVYVEPDTPCAGWTTYIHKLEEGGEGGIEKPFQIRQLWFSKQKFDIFPMGKVSIVNVYGKNDEPLSYAPSIFSVIREDGIQIFYVRAYSQYLLDSSVNPQNLPQKLNTL